MDHVDCVADEFSRQARLAGRNGMRATVGLLRTMVLVAALTASGAAVAADADNGKSLFAKRCSICHAVGEDAEDKTGPTLNGLDGRKVGADPDFLYSDALKNSGIVWSAATFKRFITDPAVAVPDTKMVFAGIKDAAEIDDLWAYLAQFNADGGKK
jgi:cytochrome c